MNRAEKHIEVMLSYLLRGDELMAIRYYAENRVPYSALKEAKKRAAISGEKARNNHLTNLSGGGIHNGTTTGDATMNEYHQFTKGQKIRSVFGKTLIVSEQIGCMVYVEGSSKHYHPSKLFAVK